MRLSPLVLSAAALLAFAAAPSQARSYYPECLWSSEILIEREGNTVICQNKNDPDDWNSYEFIEAADGLYDVTLIISVDYSETEYSSADAVAVMMPGVDNAVFLVESDQTITPDRDANMVLAAMNQDKINALRRTRARYIGY